MKKLLPLLLTFLIACDLGTNQEPPMMLNRVCGVGDPLNEISWINNFFRQIQDEPEINGIVLFIYRDEEIIELQRSLFSSTNMHQYRCDGSRLIFDEENTYDHYLENRVEVGVLFGTNIWRFD